MEFEPMVIEKQLLHLLQPEQAWHFGIIPKGEHKETRSLEFFIDQEKYTDQLQEEIEMALGKKIILYPTETSFIQKMLFTHYRKVNDRSSSEAVATNVADPTFFLSQLIAEAKKLGSSDIHIETYKEKSRVRVRIDGLLVERHLLKKTDYPALINQIKIKAGLDISEKRLPQDGRIHFDQHGLVFDIRVSVTSTMYGEKVVLRLLNNDSSHIDIHRLGFSEIDLTNYLQGIKKTHGIVLVSGPTGHGKTTTLYATLKVVNKETVNVLTIEDPIEYTLEGVNQVQLREDIGLSFDVALKTFLRQDPDIIMLGEIRDAKTASMAIRAAMTGHLVLSTIHTNSAWGIVSRLVDMGVPAYLIASTINTAVAQRLIRLLCPHCKSEEAFDAKLFPSTLFIDKKITHHFIAKGCEHCHYSGYKGRKAIYEVIPIDAEFSELIRKNVQDISQQLKTRGIKTLQQNALEVLEEGMTSIEEIYPILLNQ